ncbi:hypothetical protein BDQ94DRAFT_45777 [Aspergillus welwitschiae]|uniref:Uncharacterized protein n=1 Tax=Aspergillus welwitschiae TaxID=1341132 RepID=A0A3F3QHN5_9EURO|nr:hypothetical protein BDQ94DRAFT_45777 [Aspergillus welwitschiae]RDH38590.1 hypothetical protein BDQ94DRAFT_45777 [Aspergillus welwitschiae]
MYLLLASTTTTPNMRVKQSMHPFIDHYNFPYYVVKSNQIKSRPTRDSSGQVPARIITCPTHIYYSVFFFPPVTYRPRDLECSKKFAGLRRTHASFPLSFLPSFFPFTHPSLSLNYFASLFITYLCHRSPLPFMARQSISAAPSPPNFPLQKMKVIVWSTADPVRTLTVSGSRPGGGS